MPADAVLAILAGLIAAPAAWASTRMLEPSRPGWAVRLYLRLFRSSDIPALENAAKTRDKFPRREAFLATFFLLFFGLFLLGLLLWPAARGP